jgi:hypothetical protein
MSQLRFQDEPLLQAARITDDEAREVIALWSEERAVHERVNAPSTVSDLAEGLEITPDEARRLLGEVRARKAEAERRETETLAAQQERVEARARLAEAEARVAEAEARKTESQARRINATQALSDPALASQQSPEATRRRTVHILIAAVVLVVSFILTFLLASQ